MKTIWIAGVLFVPALAFAAIDDFNSLIAQGYKDQAAAYQQVKKATGSYANDGTARKLADLSRSPSSEKDFRIKLRASGNAQSSDGGFPSGPRPQKSTAK